MADRRTKHFAYATFRKVLDNLLGEDRDLLPEERTGRSRRAFDDPEVDRAFLCGCSPWVLLAGTKSENMLPRVDGPPLIQDDKLKGVQPATLSLPVGRSSHPRPPPAPDKWDAAPQEEKDTYGFELETMELLEGLVSAMDARVKSTKARITATAEVIPPPPELAALKDQIQELITKAEVVAESGEVDLSMSLKCDLRGWDPLGPSRGDLLRPGWGPPLTRCVHETPASKRRRSPAAAARWRRTTRSGVSRPSRRCAPCPVSSTRRATPRSASRSSGPGASTGGGSRFARPSLTSRPRGEAGAPREGLPSTRGERAIRGPAARRPRTASASTHPRAGSTAAATDFSRGQLDGRKGARPAAGTWTPRRLQPRGHDRPGVPSGARQRRISRIRTPMYRAEHEFTEAVFASGAMHARARARRALAREMPGHL